MTGLSDEQRADFKLMKAVGEFTIQAPPKRIQNLQLFGKRVNSVKAIEDKMDSWKLSLEKDLAQMKGRTLPPEQILCGGMFDFYYLFTFLINLFTIFRWKKFDL